jgi:hypothetical protein
LQSVVFVEDYVQPEWKKSHLTANTMPTVELEGVEYRCDSPEYRQAMYNLVGKALCNVSVIAGEKAEFVFSDAAVLAVSLRDSDYVVPEAMLHGEADGRLWVV